MTINHSKVTPEQLMLIVQLNRLTDAELDQSWPNLVGLSRDEKIKRIVFGK